MVVRGSAEHTREVAIAVVAGLCPDRVLWLGDPREQDHVPSLSRCRVSTALGRSLDAVVFDAHGGLDPDAFGAAHGLVWGGGGFVLRLSPPLVEPPALARARLAAFPYAPADVGTRFARHVERALARAEWVDPEPLSMPPRVVGSHDEQARVVGRLVQAWSGTGPSRVVLLAGRGRGKSSALGLALAALRERPWRVAVTAPHPDAVAEVVRFAQGEHASAPAGLRFVPLPELVFGTDPYDLVVVDEAAQLPVPMLRRLTKARAGAHIAMATTTHGYEGTGRGFVLRLLPGLERGPVPVQRLTLHAPIRWSAGDPLERLAFDALLLDAEPAALPEGVGPRDGELRAVALDRDRLLDEPATLRELFGLLVQAHYRTTPGDLHRLLDAPNLAVHVLCWRDHIVAATIVAEEGGLPPERCDAMARGAERILGHALADALVTHLGHRAAGGLRMIRSMRIATHPRLRRRGLATRLVEHVHAQYTPDLFGTMFGVTPELLAFRRRIGYRLVRLSASRGARAGEPSVMMLRAVSARARALVELLRAELARDLPRQIELLDADEQTLIEPALIAALQQGVPPPAPLSAATSRALVESYASGPRTAESVALALARFVEAHGDRLGRLPPPERVLVEGRVVQRQGWRRVAQRAGMSVPAAMRGLRRAIRRLLDE
ncbi:MAG: GNAT family N-acetyltransferase [Myxococcota bacterium]